MPRSGRSSGRAQPAAAAPPKKKPGRKTKARSRATALDAFAIAGKQVQPDRKVLAHGRDQYLHPEPEQGHKKHRRDEDEDDEDEDGDDGDDAPRKKKPRSAFDDDEDDDEAGSDEMASDSEGHEWRVGVGADDDSDIDSDEAFDEDDEERFEGFTFRGSSSKGTKKKKEKEEADLSEGDEDEGDSDDSLGEDAIDLAQALDQVSDDESSADDSDSGSEEDDESASESPDDDDDEEEEDSSKFGALQSLVKGYAGAEDDEQGPADGQSKAKISLSDLGLFGVKDPHMKKSLKLLNKEEKAAKPGSTKKLDVPLAKRQQDRLLRSAAYEKTNETLDRWTDTVKQNRRADHLFFPLPHTLPNAGLDNGELLPLTRKTAASELEQTIMSIMEESGLGPSARDKEQQEMKRKADEAEAGAAQSISRADLEELWAQRRRDRELKSREQARSKRIKKIKSKTYRRVHRREQLRDEQAAEEALAAEGGGPDSDEEREALHRQRALERMGARHRESKWAKRAAKVGRAAWDDEVRAGLTDMARRDAELRRRIEGRAGSSGGDDDEEGLGSGSEGDDDDDEGDDRARLLRKLDDLDKEGAGDDGAPQSGLMQMKFMQRAEAQRKKENDELVAQMRRDLLSDDEDRDDDGGEPAEVGRRTYGVPKAKSQGRAEAAHEAVAATGESAPAPKARSNALAPSLPLSAAAAAEPQPSAPGAAGAWSRAAANPERRRDKKHAADAAAAATELDLGGSVLVAAPAKAGGARTKTKTRTGPAPIGGGGRQPDSEASDSEGEAGLHLPLAVRDRALVARAFAGEDVVGEFEAEKAAAAFDDDERVVDRTLPGWGSWVGEGVSERERRRHQGRFLAKKEGVRKADRRDARLERVIVNEKRVKKNDKYLASQLPHPFESRDQYERSLRLPLGPEWVTKESFQDATKPRVIIKQGVIAPMLKPLV